MITSLRLQNYRSYTDSQFGFSPSVNIIAGPNASGKTNLLEAVQVVALGGSYRAKDNELMGFGAEWSRLDAQTSQGQKRVVKIQSGPSVRKSFEIDDKILARLSTAKMLPLVLFEPDHLLLLSGSPDLRRAFLDDLISRVDPSFGAIRRHYRRVLSHRNALLKSNPADLNSQLFVWNLRLSELGGQIARARLKLIHDIDSRALDLYKDLSSRGNHVGVQYVSKFPADAYETHLLKKLEDSVQLDIARGHTVYGPHRDDVMITIDDHPAQEAASRGEVRTIVLTLKMIELSILEAYHQIKPILLLDDVFSELDAERRQALTNFVKSHQTFITTTDADILSDYFSAPNVIRTAV